MRYWMHALPLCIGHAASTLMKRIYYQSASISPLKQYHSLLGTVHQVITCFSKIYIKLQIFISHFSKVYYLLDEL